MCTPFVPKWILSGCYAFLQQSEVMHQVKNDSNLSVRVNVSVLVCQYPVCQTIDELTH